MINEICYCCGLYKSTVSVGRKGIGVCQLCAVEYKLGVKTKDIPTLEPLLDLPNNVEP